MGQQKANSISLRIGRVFYWKNFITPLYYSRGVRLYLAVFKVSRRVLDTSFRRIYGTGARLASLVVYVDLSKVTLLLFFYAKRSIRQLEVDSTRAKDPERRLAATYEKIFRWTVVESFTSVSRKARKNLLRKRVASVGSDLPFKKRRFFRRLLPRRVLFIIRARKVSKRYFLFRTL